MQCKPVPADFWAPLGSALPEACPPTGFFCPREAGTLGCVFLATAVMYVERTGFSLMFTTKVFW